MKNLMLFAATLLLNILWLSIVSAACSVNTSSVAFGSFSPLSDMTIDSTGNITVTCDTTTPYTIALSPGGSGTYTTRSMSNGSYYLYYNLFLDLSYSQVWGNGTGGSYTVSDSTDTIPKNHTVYGRISLNSQRGAMVGSYSDSITVTVTY